MTDNRSDRQPASHSPELRRKRFVGKTVVFALLIAVALLKPKVDAWLAEENGPAVAANQSSGNDVKPRPTTGDAFDRGVGDSEILKITDPERPETDRGDRLSTAQRPADTSSSSAADEDSAEKRQPEIRQSQRQQAETPQKDKPALGQLSLVRGTRDEFLSTAGLMYVRGSEDGHRLKHVLKHSEDDPDKPVHGVFDGDRDQILAWLDQAWMKGRQGGKGVRTEEQGGRVVYTVDIGEKVGYVGGHIGKRKGNPPCRFLKLVIQDGDQVVTAYPVQSL